mgnify:CR=1 FL=1
MNEPTRQVHLDFHTSEHIPEVGNNFSKEQFKKALKLGNINQINIFGKCHHGWCYYPTKIKHAKMHPNLKIDLLGQQIEACHEINVKSPIYLTVGWSAYDVDTHPEWCSRDIDGNIIEWNKKKLNEVEEISTRTGQAEKELILRNENFRPFTNWKFLCPSGDYKELISNMVTELIKNYEVDGFFFDIHFTQLKCYCDNCKKSIKINGYDINNAQEVNNHWNDIVLRNFTKDITNQIQSLKPKASIFYNCLTVLERKENITFRLYENATKFDLEDLPTTWGGYDKLATQSRYFHNYSSKAIVAMSGKFHTMWGEFGGFKYPEALKYEAAAMISHGARCNFGDHLHPSGEMDLSTYKNVGIAYEYVKSIEEYGIGGKPYSNIALYLTGSFYADDGAARMGWDGYAMHILWHAVHHPLSNAHCASGNSCCAGRCHGCGNAFCEPSAADSATCETGNSGTCLGTVCRRKANHQGAATSLGLLDWLCWHPGDDCRPIGECTNGHHPGPPLYVLFGWGDAGHALEGARDRHGLRHELAWTGWPVDLGVLRRSPKVGHHDWRSIGFPRLCCFVGIALVSDLGCKRFGCR